MKIENLHPGLNLGVAHGEAHTRSEPVDFGFWVFLMSYLILFGILVGTYVAMSNGTAGGPAAHSILALAAHAHGRRHDLDHGQPGRAYVLIFRSIKKKRVVA